MAIKGAVNVTVLWKYRFLLLFFNLEIDSRL